MSCDCGCPDSSDNYSTMGDLAMEFQGFKAGMYRAAEMLGAPQYVLVLLAGSTTRDEVVGRFGAWVEQ